jgi:hypothetical protein
MSQGNKGDEQESYSLVYRKPEEAPPPYPGADRFRWLMGLGVLGFEGCPPLPDFMSPGCGRVYID